MQRASFVAARPVLTSNLTLCRVSCNCNQVVYDILLQELGAQVKHAESDIVMEPGNSIRVVAAQANPRTMSLRLRWNKVAAEVLLLLLLLFHETVYIETVYIAHACYLYRYVVVLITDF
jgi:F0F1-type ATP synthase membrane subunit a